MQKFKNLSRKKKIRYGILSVLIFYLVYVIISVTIPFANPPKVSEEFKQSVNLNAFYSDTISVDRAAIVETSQDALDVRIHMINQAKEKIAISSFSIKHDRSCKEIASAVLAAANRGVKVQILVDGLTGNIDMGSDPIYYALGTQENVEIRYYNILNLLKPWTANGRLHDKYLIVDDSLLLLGGRNISNYFLGEYNTNVLSYDRDILVYNTAAKTSRNDESVLSQVWSYFETIWNDKMSEPVFDRVPRYKNNKVSKAYETLGSIYQDLKTSRPQLFTEVDYVPLTVPTNKVSLITNPIHIMAKEPHIWYQMAELMKNAEKRVYIQSPYAVLDSTMYQDMNEISNKVPDFRMLINSTAGGDNVMASSDYTFNKRKVIKTGVQIFEFQGEHSMHDKSILIDDDISIIGSFNVDMRSAYLDTEVMLVVHGTEFNKQLESYMYAMQDKSLPVHEDASYGTNGNVIPLKISTGKKMLYNITSAVFQLFRYLL
ncbi:phospholipase D-like domain-containing protein [Lachnoclostridium phytofermentans]|uniref:Phospholipase D/Transphosphatidylase n=1 Tax=Lachnoclostridium phytofermentans (strain ATCC 700394 / DSM 18823 / ISDg) TaxID=357809 RepID=A9KTD9_LACP7|nr:phospholipase D-like domain-containing protein [Lachnoclostridium phytofermentans]ABX43769.1 phospholipase D/Transphosphatidylase [Lachnoclostridium phytofermentans ISDg]